MSKAAWQHLEELFNEAAELPPSSRAAFLRKLAAAEPDIADELRSLLESAASADIIVQNAVGKAMVDYTNDRELPFLILGPYRLLKEIGRGGMGAVYLAQREEHYEQKVAIKIVKRGMDSEFILERFRHERQILARLNHPYIAHMLDGGITPDGRPYLVMDYVEGSKVTTFCREQALSLRQKIELFRKICEAVQFAHQNLVIHRDLKPGNILIEADGTPKLLDFGLAKLMESNLNQNQTVAEAGGLLFTPAYASPEQASGEPVSTATDTFALGAILFELLTGQPIRDIDSTDPASVSRTIRESSVRRARSVAPNLDRDLDNILGKSLQTDPQRRYGTAELLSEDLRRYLVGLPVGAVPDDFAYRLQKFVSRNRYQVAGAALFVGTLAAGLATTTWQAHRAEEQSAIARAERAKADQLRVRAESESQRADAARAKAETEAAEALRQKSIAEVERVQAELRFSQVRQIAGTFLFDFHGAIADLPGSLPARKMVVEKGLQYLDGLSKEGLQDPSFQHELAEAYLRIGDIQGEPALPNIGDLAGAMKSYQKGLALVEDVLKRQPSAAVWRTKFALVERISRANLSGKSIAAGAEMLPPVMEEARRLQQQHPSNDNLFAVAMLEANYAVAQQQLTKPDIALRYYHLAADKFRALSQQKPPYPDADARLSATLGGQSDMQASMGQLQRAVELVREQLALVKAIEEREPNNSRHMRQVARTYLRLGNFLGNPSGPNLMRPEEALVPYREALKIFDRLAAADPLNVTAVSDQASAHRYLGDIYGVLHRDEESLPEFEVYAKTELALSKRDPANTTVARLYADSQSRLALANFHLKRYTESIRLARNAIQTFEELERKDPTNLYTVALQIFPYRDISENYQALGDHTRAMEAVNKGLALAVDVTTKRPATVTYQMVLSEMLGVRGKLQAAQARKVSSGDAATLRNAALIDYDRALAILNKLDQAGKLPEEEKRTTVADLVRDRNEVRQEAGK